MKPISISRTHVLLALALTVTATGFVVQNSRWSRRMDIAEERLTKTEQLLKEVAGRRYQEAQVVVTMPDGRHAEMPLLQETSDRLETHERRRMTNWSGPDEWGEVSSGGYSWRYIGSEGDRDIYEFVVVFGKRLPAEPDERSDSAVVRYVSYRNAPVTVVSESGFSIALSP